ncbi:hypothetical protein BX600DRAFT_443251 [Xylariales sp. PMI_506]|nr:hypothetical protein BX600DRAFT_443251 [Xylariales sp. PMI_506]
MWWFHRVQPSSSYIQVKTGVLKEEEERETCLDPDTEGLGLDYPSPSRRTAWSQSTIWLVIMLTLVGFITGYISRGSPTLDTESFERGYSTDLELAKSSIRVHGVRFTGGLKYDDNGTLYRNHPPDQKQYVGQPSSELDSAWEEIIGDRYVAFTEKQRMTIPLAMHKFPNGVYHAASLANAT